jgi:hypothetical protein
LSARSSHTNEGAKATVVLVFPALVEVVVLFAAQEKHHVDNVSSSENNVN